MSNKKAFYTSEREIKRSKYFASSAVNDGSTDILLEMIGSKIAALGSVPYEVLDLGTGNGYLLREVARRWSSAGSGRYRGIDSSSDMIDAARHDTQGGLLQFDTMDNTHTSFADNQFDFVIAKAVSNVSVSEVLRVLKPEAWFLYKEYGPGKGLVEILDDGHTSHTGDGMIEIMKQCGFSYLEIHKYHVPLVREKRDVYSLIDTMRILPSDLTVADVHARIERFFGKKNKKTIHSDSYIIVGRK